MEASWIIPWLVFTSLLLGLCTSDETGEHGAPGMDGSPGYPGEKGHMGIPGLQGIPGPKGLQGAPGMDGPPGYAGEPGDMGMPGLQGMPGPKGEYGARGMDGAPGYPGEKGDMGMPGLPGMPGEKGETGSAGQSSPLDVWGFFGLSSKEMKINFRNGEGGERREKGEKGEQVWFGPIGLQGPKGDRGYVGMPGRPGPRGLPGLNGAPGECACSATVSEHDDKITTKSNFPLGSRENPLQDVCKNMANVIDPLRYPLGQQYSKGPSPMEVNCVQEDDKVWTCLQPTNFVKVVDSTNNNPPLDSFWISSKNITLQDMYNITYNQLVWIQEKSSEAYQQIEYETYCRDATPFNPEHEDFLSPLLLSWNDVVFGPKPRDTTPLIYTKLGSQDPILVPNLVGIPRSTLIKIQSSARRLPVIDIYIRNLRECSASIQFHELCFY